MAALKKRLRSETEVAVRLPDPALDPFTRPDRSDPAVLRDLSQSARSRTRMDLPHEPEHRGRRLLTEQRDSILSA